MRNLSFLLLQARHDGDPMREQEQDCFANKIGVEPDQIACWDLLMGPPAFSIVSSYDILMMGGSGDYLVSQRDLPQFSAMLALLVEVVDRGYPTFASCFGFQCMVEALGGQIVYDPANTEVGTYELTLTPEGTEDPVLGRLPRRFDAQMGRKDRAEKLPEGVVHLATSERCPYQAFRIPDKPIWATQFHPELSCDENRERYVRYVSNYEHHVDDATRKETLKRFQPSPHTGGMLGRFVELVAG